MKTLKYLLLGCMIIGLTFMGCGDDDCTVCPDDPPPVEKEYHFLYNFVGDFYHSAVLTYSTRTGEVVDSTYYGRFPFWDVKFSKAGRYAYYTSSDVGFATTWVIEYATGDTISVLQGTAGQWLSVSGDDRFLLLTVSTTVRLFRVPQLEVVYERTQTDSWPSADIHPFRNMAIVPNLSEDSLLILDFTTDEISDHKIAIRLYNGERMRSSRAIYSLDGKKLILMGGPFPCCGSVIQVRDAETLEILQEYRPGHIGPYLHPDGARVFFIEPWRDLGGIPSSVWELNLRTLLMRKILDGLDYVGTQPYFFGLNPSDMDITPDGKYAFLISGGEGMEHGPILKLDLDIYEIVDAFYPPGGVARSIRMYPLEISR